MYIFKGLDLNVTHILPSTERWIRENMNNLDFPIYITENGYGYIVWVYSCNDEEVLQEIPDDLRTCIQYAIEKDCRIINLDAGGEFCEDLPRYEAEWEGAVQEEQSGNSPIM